MSPRQKTAKNPKSEWMRYFYSSAMREISQLQEEMKKDEKNMKFLRGEALLHQVHLSSNDADVSMFGPEAEKLYLSNKYIDILEKRRATQELFTVSGMSKLELAVDRLEEDSEGSRKDRTIPGAVFVVKMHTVEGKVGNVAYAADFLASYDRDNEREVDEVTSLKCSSHREIIKQATQSDQPLTPTTLHSITSDLYFLQVLESEREESLSQLEADIPNFDVVRDLEPIDITFIPARGHEVNIRWKIIWDARNKRYKYDIAVACTDEVAARFRKVEEVHPYLSGQSQLLTCQDVTDFVEAFEL